MINAEKKQLVLDMQKAVNQKRLELNKMESNKVKLITSIYTDKTVVFGEFQELYAELKVLRENKTV